MFTLRYAAHELRHRLGRTILTALGLAAGVGLVIGIIGVSEGLDEAQGSVLSPLSAIGTDILVTRVAGAAPAAPGASPVTTQAPAADQRQGGQRGQGGGFGGFFGGGQATSATNDADVAALLNENRSVVTDLSKLGKPGDKFVHDFFLPGTFISFPSSAVGTVGVLPHVTSAVGALTLQGSHQTGTVPNIVAEIQTGGETLTQTVRPDPLTDAEEEAIRTCLQEKGVSFGRGGQGGGGGDAEARRGAFNECLPERMRQFIATVVTPLRTIQQVVNPPSTDIANTTYTAAGVDPRRDDAGLITKDQLSSGQWFDVTNKLQVIVSKAYADGKDLAVGSITNINGQNFTVVGHVVPAVSGVAADMYFPLETLQDLASKQGRVNQVLVKVDDADRVDEVAAAIKQELPGAQVVTTAALAGQVTGSLTDAKKLADRLGGALAIIVLVATFIIALLLTLSSIAKRVRELGTLRALGWSRGKVVRQVLTETIGIGVVGGALGILTGLAANLAVGAFSPKFQATSSGVAGLTQSSFGRLFNEGQAAAETASVSLEAPLSMGTLAMGVGFALLGGLLAGLVGGWRAARLTPAEALRTVG